jgi:hypothetical protein
MITSPERNPGTCRWRTFDRVHDDHAAVVGRDFDADTGIAAGRHQPHLVRIARR